MFCFINDDAGCLSQPINEKQAYDRASCKECVYTTVGEDIEAIKMKLY